MPGIATEERQIQRFWRAFIAGKVKKNSVLRPEIYESWLRCRRWKLDPYMTHVRVLLEEAELQKIRERKKDFLKVAVPVVQDIYSVVKGTGFGVWLTDENGVVLLAVSDEEDMEKCIAFGFIPGGKWTEDSAGTNAIGTALYLQRPVQINYAEHYCQWNHQATCSAAPIFDETGSIIGVLDITGRAERSNPHTLGIVVAGARAIQRELRLQAMYNEVRIAHRYVLEVAEAFPSGIVVINKDMRVNHITRKACSMLRKTSDYFVGKRINEVFGEVSCVEKALKHGRIQEDEEVHLEIDQEKFHFIMTCRPIMNEWGPLEGAVLILREMENARRMAAKMAGYTAKFTFDRIIGKDQNFVDELKRAKAAARTSSNVLIVGESGTGKEMVAQAIHNESPRRHGPFVAINCGALPKELIGSELFGYEEGAFTGAKKGGSPGKFELANNGTLFLDEIGDMPLDLQLTLLRVLQDKVVVRLGGQRPIQVNVRLIAATNKDLQQLIAKGLFRQDLFYRINVITIKLPPLRERPADISLLADHFIDVQTRRMGKPRVKLRPEALRALEKYSWPGNVRELENVIEQALVFCDGEELGTECLNIPMNLKGTAVTDQESLRPKTLRGEEKSIIESTLKECLGNKAEAARRLGITRATLYRKMRHYDIELDKVWS